jgi:hypothetical protein
MDSYTIVCSNVRVDDVISQVRAIKSYPCMVKIYDRIFMLRTSDERDTFTYGLEIGSYITQDQLEANFPANDDH